MKRKFVDARVQSGHHLENIVKCISLALVAVLAMNSATFGKEAPASQDLRAMTLEAAQASKVKAAVQKRGISQRSRVRVTMLDGSQVIGRISRIDEEFFDVSDKAGETTRLQYAEAKKISGMRLSKGAKIGITVAVVLVAVEGAAAAAASRFNLRVGRTHATARVNRR
jgi:hypothetical protein